EVHDGEHVGIIDPDVWQRVQTILRRNGASGGALARNRFGALLKGLLRCQPCQRAMVPSITTRSDSRRYRYYVCTGAQKCGWASCPSKAVPAGQIENLVVQQIRAIGTDPDVVAQTLAQADIQAQERTVELELERKALERDLAAWSADVANLAAQMSTKDQNTTALARLADLQERLRNGERRLIEVRAEIVAYQSQRLTEHELETALAAFGPVWQTLTPREQTRMVQLLVERVDYDGGKGKVAITFHVSGIKTLTGELAAQGKEKIA